MKWKPWKNFQAKQRLWWQQSGDSRQNFGAKIVAGQHCVNFWACVRMKRTRFSYKSKVAASAVLNSSQLRVDAPPSPLIPCCARYTQWFGSVWMFLFDRKRHFLRALKFQNRKCGSMINVFHTKLWFILLSMILLNWSFIKWSIGTLFNKCLPIWTPYKISIVIMINYYIIQKQIFSFDKSCTFLLII